MSGNVRASDPRVKRTRELLRQALMSLVEEQDFNKITVQDITERAEVNRATFYAHFEDKYGLVNYALREMFLDTLNRRLPSAKEFSEENLRLLIQISYELSVQFADKCKRPRCSIVGNPPIEVQLQACIYDVLLAWFAGLQAHQMFPGSPQIVAGAVSWTIFGSASHWAHSDRSLPAEQVSDQLLTMILSGLQGFSVSLHAPQRMLQPAF